MGAQAVIRNLTGLFQSQHTFLYLYINPAIMLYRLQVILVYDILRGVRGYCFVEQHFGGYQSCTLCCCHSVKFHPVSSHDETDAVSFRLVWSDLSNNLAICDCFDIGVFTSGNKEDGIVPFWHTCSYPLGQSI